MKTNLKVMSIAAVFTMCFSEGVGHAGPVAPLTTFTAGTPALASEVNGNFSAVKTAVDDNNSRITSLEGVNAASRITALETVVTPAGNIVLAPSTASTGNILKGTTPFIHNFGTDNTFIGVNAGNFTMTGGGGNTASGSFALFSNTTGTFNTASGASALQNNTTGQDNTAVGLSALASNTDGTSNTAIGRNALFSNSSGIFNTASGTFALQNNTSGSGNTASGRSALVSNTTGGGNTASGVSALQSNTTGVSNTASGGSALFGNTTGENNTASGAGALGNNTSGSSNIAIGFEAGFDLTTGDNNIDIGSPGIAGESSTIRIGAVQTSAFIAGISGVVVTGVPVLVSATGQLGVAASSRSVKDDIADMGEASGALMKLRPVTFHYKTDRNPEGRTLQYGLVAEEVAKVVPGLVARSADGEIETVYYQFLAPMLLNEVQKQQRTIETQAAELTKQTARIEALENQASRMGLLLEKLEQEGRNGGN